MWLFYIDESGNTGMRRDDPDQPIHYLVAVGVHESRIRAFEQAIALIAAEYFPNDWRKSDFEFKGNELKGRGGRYFSAKTPDGDFVFPIAKRLEIAKRLLMLISQFGAVVFVSTIHKQNALKLAQANGTPVEHLPHPHQEAFADLVQQLDAWLRTHDPKELGLLVADEHDELEQRLIDDLNQYKWLIKQSNEPASGVMPAEQIVDSVHFVRSANNPLIQIADLAAFVCNVGNAISPEHPFHRAYLELLEIVNQAGNKKPTKV
jgi:Protein of unknown function (DUF3800)